MALQDLKYSVRGLAKSPLFAVVAALTLGLGIGVNTTTFSSLNGWLLRPLPVKDGKQLVVLAVRDSQSEIAHGLSYPDYVDYRKLSQIFRDSAVYYLTVANYHRQSVTDRMWVEAVSGSYFPMLGLTAAEGRLIGPSDERNALLVLSYSTWKGRFGGDREVIGSTVRLNAHTFTIAGVAPESYHGGISYVDSDGFVPLRAPGFATKIDDREERMFRVLARLQPGVSLEQARAAVMVLAGSLAKQYPAEDKNVHPVLVRETDARPEPGITSLRRMVLGGMALVGVLLLIACANIANLLLVRASRRSREFAIRAAMGASRGRLIGLVFTESALVAAAGLIAGLLLSSWMRWYLSSYQPGVDFRFRQNYAFDGHVLAFSIGLMVLTTLLCGAFPAIRIARWDLNQTIKQAASPSGSGRQRASSVLVIAQVAACTLLLACTGFFARGLENAARIHLGYQLADREVFSYNLGKQGAGSQAGQELIKKLVDRVKLRPDVTDAAFVEWLPFSGSSAAHVYREDEVPDKQHAGREVMSNIAGPDYFHAMGTRILEGRDFSERDDATRKPVAMVNQAFASRLWPSEQAVGKKFKIQGENEPRQVVGVVETGKYFALDETPQPWYYVPLAQQPTNWGALVVHSRAPAQTITAEVREDFRAIDPELPVYGVMTLEHLVGHSYVFGPPRMGTEMAATFSLLGLALAAIGLYGVIAYSVAQRTKEIGIRMGLGASRSTVMRMVMGQGFMLIGCGFAAGLILALLVGSVLRKILYGVNPADPLTFGCVTALLAVVGVAACYLPARSAANVDPAIALRAE